MSIKNIIIYSLLLSSYCVPIFSLLDLIQPALCINTNGEKVILREVHESDFEAIKELGIHVFSQVYKFTTLEQVTALRRTYDLIIAEEVHNFNNNRKRTIALVAIHDNKII